MSTMPSRVHPVANVPFYGRLRHTYKEWVPPYMAGLKLKPEIELLEKQIDEIRNTPLGGAELLKVLKPMHDEAQQRRVTLLAKHLADFRHPGMKSGPFDDVQSFLGQMGRVGELMAPSFTWDEITAAIKLLPVGITEASRAKQTEKLMEQINKLKAELADTQPAGRYVWNAAKPMLDSWHEFVTFWADTQKRITAAVGPQAIRLDVSPPEEREAWKLLGLEAYVNPRGRMHPAQP
jgi:hypothetical protein